MDSQITASNRRDGSVASLRRSCIPPSRGMGIANCSWAAPRPEGSNPCGQTQRRKSAPRSQRRGATPPESNAIGAAGRALGAAGRPSRLCPTRQTLELALFFQVFASRSRLDLRPASSSRTSNITRAWASSNCLPSSPETTLTRKSTRTGDRKSKACSSSYRPGRTLIRLFVSELLGG